MELTINEIAKLSGKSIKYIRREIASGSLKSLQIGNKKKITQEDFIIWNKNNDKENNISFCFFYIIHKK